MDPIGETGGENLYALVRNSPVMAVDPNGLSLYCHGYCPPQPPPTPRRTAGQCCADAKAAGLAKGDNGGVICCDGVKMACAWYTKTGDPSRDAAIDILIACTTAHETDHLDAAQSCFWNRPCTPLWRTEMLTYSDKAHRAEECDAHATEMACLNQNESKCDQAPNPERCRKRIEDEKKQLVGRMQSYCGGLIR